MIPKTRKALIVDDSDDDRTLFSRFLHRLPHFKLIGCLRDGAEAVNYLKGTDGFGERSRHPYPDLLLLDYQMPGLNGIEVLTFLQSEKIRPRVILWSDTPELLDQKLARHLGADLVCRKPLDGQGLRRIIAGLGWPTSGMLPRVRARANERQLASGIDCNIHSDSRVRV